MIMILSRTLAALLIPPALATQSCLQSLRTPAAADTATHPSAHDAFVFAQPNVSFTFDAIGDPVVAFVDGATSGRDTIATALMELVKAWSTSGCSESFMRTFENQLNYISMPPVVLLAIPGFMQRAAHGFECERSRGGATFWLLISKEALMRVGYAVLAMQSAMERLTYLKLVAILIQQTTWDADIGVLVAVSAMPTTLDPDVRAQAEVVNKVWRAARAAISDDIVFFG